MANKTEITSKQNKMIVALLTARTIGLACEAAQVGRSTLARWMDEPAFRAALEGETKAALEGLSRSLVVLGEKATKTLDQAMDDNQASTSAKVRAADVVLSRLLQLKEMVDLEERITALEAAQNDPQK